MTPWKPTAFHLLLNLSELQAQEMDHLLTSAPPHLVFRSASQVSGALITVFILLASEETWTTQGGKHRRHLRRRARKATQTSKGVDHILQKAEFPTSIRTWNKKQEFLAEITDLSEKNICVNKGQGEKNKRWRGRGSYAKSRRQG